MRELLKGKALFVYLVMALVLAIAFSALFVYINAESNKEQVFTKSDKGGIVIKMVNPLDKHWRDATNHPDIPVGGEYDFTVFNHVKGPFKNWTAKLVFNVPIEIDSSWNGEFIVDSNTISFTPDDNLQTVEDSSEVTFGTVLYSKEDLVLMDYEIRGYIPLEVKRMPVFYILASLTGIWLFFFTIHLVSYARVESLKRQRERDRLIIKQAITTFTNFIDARDPYTKGHSVRVAIYSKEVAARYGIEGDELNDLYYAALLHDAGKIGIPDAILRKPDKLTEEEYETIKTHTIIGDEILTKFTAIPNIRDGAHYHHERFDGKGFPEGLRERTIPLNARIIAIADSFDTMSSHRSYREPYDNEKIINELESNSGTQFDPELVPLMVDLIREGFTDKIRSEYGAENS
ncbi:HD domain-containing protein [Lachnospiraceae bacterium XPB1003]|nr:HD domain-containing protein [Lachnospiraceae bacterium XPB1003]